MINTTKIILILTIIYFFAQIINILACIYAIFIVIPIKLIELLSKEIAQLCAAIINYPLSWISGILYVVYIAINSKRNKFENLFRIKFLLIEDLEPIEMLHIYETPNETLNPFGEYYWIFGKRFVHQESRDTESLLIREIKVIKTAAKQDLKVLIPWLEWH